jgi:hypothetical protein
LLELVLHCIFCNQLLLGLKPMRGTLQEREIYVR